MKTLIEEKMEEREKIGRIKGKVEPIIELIPAYISDKPSASLIELIRQASSDQLKKLMNFFTNGKITSERDALAFFNEI